MSSMAGRHVLMVPSWWPTIEQPIAGVFHLDYARAFAAAGARVGVVFPDFVRVRCFRPGRVPVVPRLNESALDGSIPVITIRGLHTALRRPALEMKRFARWMSRGYRHYERRHGRPDVVHAFCAVPAGWAAARLAKRIGAPLVLTEHTGPFRDVVANPAQGAFAREALSAANAVVAVSAHLRDQMRTAGIDRDMEVIPNPIGDAFAYRPPPEIETRDGRDTYHAVFVGRLVVDKGLDTLAAAAGRLARDTDIAVHWHIVGDGPCREALRGGLIEAVGADGFTLHGHLDKAGVLERLRAAHVLVHPSRGETFGLTVAEALCAGRPCAATRGTACEALIGSSNGALCAIGDAAGLADAVASTLRDYARWDGAAIARQARGQFGATAVARAYGGIYTRRLESDG
jgi:glycosyltransferase involved in cell wall biosynthesis